MEVEETSLFPCPRESKSLESYFTMPQVFQVLRCFKCEMFQVHQVKKSNKWQCRVCNEKQSLKKAYKIGPARDCRYLVQELNMQKSNITQETSEEIESQSDTDEVNCAIDEVDSKDHISQSVEQDELSSESSTYLADSSLDSVFEICKENPALKMADSAENSWEHEKKDLISQNSVIVEKCVPGETNHKRPLEDPIETSTMPLIKRNKGFQFILKAASKLN